MMVNMSHSISMLIPIEYIIRNSPNKLLPGWEGGFHANPDWHRNWAGWVAMGGALLRLGGPNQLYKQKTKILK